MMGRQAVPRSSWRARGVLTCGCVLGLVWAATAAQAAVSTAAAAAQAAPAPPPPTRAETQLLGHIDAIDRSLVRAEAALISGEAQVRELVAASAAAESARAAAAGAYTQAVAQLRRRLGALTRMAPGAHLVALGSAGSLAHLMDDERLLAAIARHDRSLWAAHEATRLQLEHTIAFNQEQVAALEAAQKERRVARDGLARARQRKNRALQSMRRHHSRAVGAELQLAQARLMQVVQQAPGGAEAPSTQGGAQAMTKWVRPSRRGLPWPASGPVRLGFGQHTETAFGTATFHNGWDIAAAAGSPVAAVASGVVAYASWLHGYGQVAIVEHPGGYHTVHGHLSRLQVAQGQRVRQGEVLGAVGDTGSLRGTVLYFEIRHLGLPQDPRLFMGRRG